MLIETYLAGRLIKGVYDVNKSLELDAQAVKKNIRAFTNEAAAQSKVEQHQNQLFTKMEINAKRKNAILQNHLVMFMKQYEIFRKIQFEKGRGIEELELIDKIQSQLAQYVAVPELASGKVMTDRQLLWNIALRGFSGTIRKDSEMGLKQASVNLSKSHVVQAQADSICVALDGIAEKIDILTDLLQKLGALYMKSIRELQRIVEQNGKNASRYTQADLDAINTSMYLTKLIYRIINTPLLDEEGEMEQAALVCISEGQKYLSQL